MGGLEVFCELCDLAVFNVSEIFEDGCVKAVSVYAQKGSKKRKEKQEACGAAGSVEDELLRTSTEVLLGSASNFSQCQYSAN